MGLFFPSILARLLRIRGGALGVHQGGAIRHCVVTLYVEEGPEGIMALAALSDGFQSLPPLPTSKVGPSGADSGVGGLVHTLAPCGPLQQTLL